MRKIGSLHVGWLDTSIRQLLADSACLLKGFNFFLITSLDSSTDMPAAIIAKQIIQRYPGCTLLGKGLMIRSGQILDITMAFDLFHGFDELWCFDELPRKNMPDDVWLVGPLNLDHDPVPPSLSDWMMESGCILGLGDGTGLNYATLDGETMRLLEGLTME